jgi:hypothetical protein
MIMTNQNKFSKEDSIDCARDFKVRRKWNILVHRNINIGKQNKCINVTTVLEEILKVLCLSNDHSYVFITMSLSITCYTKEQMKDLKHFLANGKKQTA